MTMKILPILALLVPGIALAQQGADADLGGGGTKILCQVNEGGTPTASNGKLNYAACDTAGRFLGAPLGTSSLAEATPIPCVVVLPTAVPTAFGTPQFAAVTNMKSMFVQNTTNIDVACALGGATTPQYIVPAGSVWYENYGANGLKNSAAIGCTRLGATPASGQLTIGGTK